MRSTSSTHLFACSHTEVSEFRRLKADYERKAVAEHRMLTVRTSGLHGVLPHHEVT